MYGGTNHLCEPPLCWHDSAAATAHAGAQTTACQCRGAPNCDRPAKVEAPSTVVVPFTLRNPAFVMTAADPQAVQPLPIATVHTITVVAAE